MSKIRFQVTLYRDEDPQLFAVLGELDRAARSRRARLLMRNGLTVDASYGPSVARQTGVTPIQTGAAHDEESSPIDALDATTFRYGAGSATT